MSKFCTVFIFLLGIVSEIESQNSYIADSLFYAKNFELAAAEYERIIFLSDSEQEIDKVLRQKYLCYKYSGNFKKASATLERCANSYEDYYQLSLCFYLCNNFDKTLETITTCNIMFDTLQTDMLLLQVLTLNELYCYDSAYSTAIKLSDTYKKCCNKDIKPLIDSLYGHKPKLKSKKIGKILAYVPGMEQIYAGYYAQGVAALTINAAVLSFGIWQILDKCYLTAYLGGATMLSVTYLGAMRNGDYLLRKANYVKTSQFNTSVKDILISELQNNP